MESWRRQKGEIQGTRSHNRKQRNDSWQPTVPSWEKKFCRLVGLVPWQKLLETKKLMYLYDNVLQWNDSAGEEAFHKAKNRFWAEMNGLPCDTSLPDPNVYIDEIDWESSIDPELLLDLDREPNVPEGDKDEKVVILDTSLLLNQSFSCIGWGDAEERKATNLPSGPGFGDCDQNWVEGKNSWESNCDPSNGTIKPRNWGDGWDEWEQSYSNEWENYNHETKNINAGRNVGVWRTFDENNTKREGSGPHVSRYKTSRYHGDYNQQTRHGWRNGRRRNQNSFAYESPFMDKKPPPRQWNNLNPWD